MSKPHDLLDRIAGRQHGLITRRQLRECGLSERKIDRLVAQGVLQRIRRGVYVTAGAPRTWNQALHAAVLAGGETAVASHSSAGRLWQSRYAPDEGFELTVHRNYRVDVPGARVHRSVVLDAADVAHRDGVPCTSFERTLCDATAQLSWLQLGSVLDDGLRRRVTTLDRLRACVIRLDSGPNRRLSVVQGLLSQRASDYNPGGSNAELRMLSVLADVGLPPPMQQFRVKVGGKTFFLDFAWPECKVFAEWYGLPWHIGATAVVGDSARLTALSSAGWRPLVFTDASSDAEIVRQTSELLAQVGWVVHRRGA